MISYRRMLEEEYDDFFSLTVRNFAKDLISNQGFEKDKADKFALNQINQFLPNGLNTQNQWIYIAEQEGVTIGHFWIGSKFGQKNHGHLFIIYIKPDYQKQGYGKTMMNHILNLLKEKNYSRMTLNVFGNNEIAKSLYKKFGFFEINTLMGIEL